MALDSVGAAALVVAPLLLAACSLWADETLARKPAETSAGGGGLEGAGGTSGSGGGGQSGTLGCGAECAAEACCEDACVDLQASEAHCGACGIECPSTQVCCAGACAGGSLQPCCSDVDCPGGKICSGNTCIAPCLGGLVACAGECVELSLSDDHCGACGNDCLAGRTCLGGGCTPPWVGVSLSGVPDARERAAAAWTGAAVFVWGGFDGSDDRADGALYDPDTNKWKPILAQDGAPSPRSEAAAVWTGKTVFVWGGGPAQGDSALGDGARFDPALGAWTGVSAAGAPSPRRSPIAVWTGSRVLVWGGTAGGLPVSGGALYDPAADAWSPMSQAGAPSAREGAAAVWSGAELYLFGGRPDGTGQTDEGFAYDPAKDDWRSLPAAGAPDARFDAFAVWAAGRLVVWGGEASGEVLEDGARYDPAADAWSPITSNNRPSKRSSRRGESGWTGATASRAILFGGMDDGNPKKDGKLYDPAADTWTGTGPAQTDHMGGAVVWTGAELFLWSGRDGSSLDLWGERYRP